MELPEMGKIRRNWLAVVVAAFAAGACLQASADVDTVYWTSTNSAGPFSYGTTSNWAKADGAVPDFAPTNGENVVLPPLTLKKSNTASLSGLTIKTGPFTGNNKALSLVYPNVDPTVGTLTGSSQYMLLHNEYVAYQVQSARRFTVSDPDGFSGFFRAGAPDSYLVLAATAEHSPAFANVSGKNRLHVEVPDAGTSASVGSVYENGVIEKNGLGTLEIGGGTGPRMDVVVTEGEAVLSGTGDEDSIDALLNRAAARFDASDLSSLEIFTDDQGLSCVSKWNDTRGADVFYAVTNNYKSTSSTRMAYCHPPFVSPATSPTGLRLVDFGTKGIDGNENYGPTNCYLQFKSGLNKVREVFYSVAMPANGMSATVVGCCNDSHYDFIANGSTYGMFPYYAETTNTWGGDIAVNGERKLNSEVNLANLREMYTVSVGTLGNTYAGAIGCERNYRSGSGGFRLGELLVFTNTLTRAERVRINAYLNAKWRTGECDSEFGAVFAPSASVSVGVPAGRTAKVRSVTAPSGLVKTGGGTLKTDRIYPSYASVTLEGGGIAFGKTPSFSAQAPSADDSGLYAWLDATVSDSVVETEVGSGTVSAWNDRRAGSSISATCPFATHPTLTTVNGMPGVNFGNYGSGSCLRLPTWTTSVNIYSGFIVVKANAADVHNIFGSSDTTMMRNDKAKIVSHTYKNPYAISAHWTIDGEPADPLEPTAAQKTKIQSLTDWHVFAFVSDVALRVDGVATERTYSTTCGGQVVGEMILFNRILPTAERLSVEAYLMEKWLGKRHPESSDCQTIASISYAAADTNVIDSAGDVRLASVSGGNGIVEKRGGGAATVSAFDAEPSSVRVEGGTLVLPCKMAFMERDALFHYDFSDARTLVVTDAVDYAGNAVSNIVSAQDVRFGGDYCVGTDPAGWSYISAMPTLVEKETAAGITRTVADLGVFATSEDATTASSISFMKANGTRRRFSNVREVHGVFSDANGSRSGWLWGDNYTGGSGGYYDYGRAYSGGGFFNGSASMCVRSDEADRRIDGVGGYAYNDAIPTGFHLVGVVATNDTVISDFGQDRSYRFGGLYVGESLAFSRVLTDKERAYLEGYLMKKWFGTEETILVTNEYETVSVAPDTTLKLDGDIATTSLAAETLVAGGTIDADFTVAENLVVPALGPAELSKLETSGAFSFSGGGTITVMNAPARMPEGVYPLVTAGAFEGDPASATLVAPFTSRRDTRLYVSGDTLYLKVENRGLMLIIE